MKFIIVDDDPLNNKVCRHILQKTIQDIDISDYLYPSEALEFIKTKTIESDEKNPVIILLDINMPLISGWDFLEIFKGLDEKIRNQYKIFILSSSIDERDIERAKDNPLVLQFISKPLTKEKINWILEVLEKNKE